MGDPPTSGDPVLLPQEQWDALEAAYAVPSRAYHHFGHVQEVLAHYHHVATDAGWKQPAEVYLAVLYHDAIYQPGARDNEARSAQLALKHLDRWLPDAGIDPARVAGLIQLTASHGTLSLSDFAHDPAAEDACHFLDCDMAILGADAGAFEAYDRAIATEYRDVFPAWLFRLNRRRFLKRLLGSERIYLSEFFHTRLEAQARANLRRALADGR